MAKNTHTITSGAAGQSDRSLTQPRQHLATTSDCRAQLQSDVRWEKVLSLRTAIACGRYNISSEAVATKLIDFMRDEAPARHRRNHQNAS